VTTNVHPLTPPPRAAGPLDGIGVIVTRPVRPAAALATKIAALGGTPLIWPAIVILPPEDGTQLAQVHAKLADVRGKRVVIFRGEGGREFLGNALRARGAIVDHVPCYRRVAPQSGADGLVEAMRDGRAHALTLTSAEGLVNLMNAVGLEGRAYLTAIPAFSVHARIAERAREYGLPAVETAGGDAGLLAGLLDWFAPSKRQAGQPSNH
jgi:uroporphyrinogen-III synthase